MFLSDLGLEYEIIQAKGVEPLPMLGEDPYHYAKRAAMAKARYVYENMHNSAEKIAVLGADTVVCIAGKILGKPQNTLEALQMLTLLAGKQHTVISAVCVIINGPCNKEMSFCDSTKVTFHAWPKDILAAYACSGECFDKAGSYAIQGQGAFLVDSIDGSWSTVVGLPVSKLVELFLQENIIMSCKV